MLALSVHSIFEGLALGLETNLTNAIDLMVAILLHKFAEALSLSISLGRAFPG
jgi:zinc transporter 1/2/3